MDDPLPRNWAECTIGDIAAPVGKIDPHDNPDREIIYIDISSIDNRANRIGETKSFRLAEAPTRARQIVKSGDVLFSTVRPYLRNIAPVPAEFDGEIASTGFSVLRPAVGIVPSFLFLKVISKEFVDTLTREQYGVSYPAVKDVQVRAQPLRLPPTKEQHRIVEKIEILFAQLDKGEEALREVQKLLARYRQSVLKAAVTGQLTAEWRTANAHCLEHGRDLLARILQTRRETWEGRGKYKEPAAPNTTDLPELPEGWVWASLDSLIYDGPTNGVSPKEVDLGGCLSFKLTATTSGTFVINEDTVKRVGIEPSAASQYWLEPGDVLIQRGNTIEYVGTAAIFRGPKESYVYPDLMMRIRFSDALIADWSVRWINFGYAKRHFRRLATGTAGNMPKINATTLKTLAVPLPSKDELRACLDLVEAAETKARPTSSWCATELFRSTALRQSILKDAFSGRLAPQNPTDETAAELLARIKQARSSAPKRVRRKASA